MLAGQITETELGEDLLSEIEKIPVLQAQIDALDGLSAYKPDQVYEKDQMVVADERIFQAKGQVPINTPPPNAAYWLDVGQSIESANGLAQQVAINTVDISELDGVVTSQATAIQTLRASSRDDNGEGELADALKGWDSTASAATETKVRTSENEAMASRQTTLEARVGVNEASITTLEQVVVTNQQTTAQQISQLNTTVGSQGTQIGQQQTMIETNSSIINDVSGKLAATWSVKMQYSTSTGQYIAAGIGLGIENTAAGLQSQFLVSADRFAIVNSIAGGAVSVPFAVQGGQVFMNSAFIMDGTITNAKIGSYISSTNYIAGQQGWILNKDGTLEINGVVPGQGRLIINSLNVSVYDANNVLRVRLGYLG
jgi:predicted phage tail protein